MADSKSLQSDILDRGLAKRRVETDGCREKKGVAHAVGQQGALWLGREWKNNIEASS